MIRRRDREEKARENKIDKFIDMLQCHDNGNLHKFVLLLAIRSREEFIKNEGRDRAKTHKRRYSFIIINIVTK